MRLYRIGDGTDRYAPSVTTVLGAVASEKSRRALESWCEKNPGAKEEACNRGTHIHEQCERYLRGLPLTLDPKYADYWRGMEEHLSKVEDLLWSERPMRPEWRSITVAGDGMPRIWSSKYLYSGTPDLVYRRRGLTILGDYKTSSGPYCRMFPKDETDRSKFTGWMKYQKVGKQLAAYAIAFEETLGIKVDACQVLVSTSDLTQNFFIQGTEFDKFKRKFLENVNTFWGMMLGDQADSRPGEMALGQYDPRLEPEAVAA